MLQYVLIHLKVNYGVLILISNVHNLFDASDPFNFLFLLRSNFHILPTFLKFIFTIKNSEQPNLEEAKAHEGKTQIHPIVQLLPNQTIISVKKSDFESDYLNFVFNSRVEKEEHKTEIVSLLNDYLHRNKDSKYFKFLMESLFNYFAKTPKITEENFVKFTEYLALLESVPSYYSYLLKKCLKEHELSDKKIEKSIQILGMLVEIGIPFPIMQLNQILLLDENIMLSHLIVNFRECLHISKSGDEEENPEYLIKDNTAFIMLKRKDVILQILQNEYKQTCKIIDNYHDTLLRYVYELSEGKHFGELHEYFRFNLFRHFIKSKYPEEFESFLLFMNIYWIFDQIHYFASYDQILADINWLLKCERFSHTNRLDIIKLKNFLYLIQQTLINETQINFRDFCAQLRSRVLFECNVSIILILGDLKLLGQPYFKTMFPTLKENTNIDVILKNPSQITALKFFPVEKKLIYSTSCGLAFIYSLNDFRITNAFMGHPSITALGICSNTQFLSGGSDSKIKLWKIPETLPLGDSCQAIITTEPDFVFQGHGETTHILCHKDIFISTGSNKVLMKADYEKKVVLKVSKAFKFQITAMSLIEDRDHFRIFVGYSNGILRLYDHELNPILFMNQHNDRIVSFQTHSAKAQIFSFSKEGDIKIIDNENIRYISDMSIFHVSHEDYITVFLNEAFGYLVGIEKKKIRFFKVANGQQIEEWTYFFNSQIMCAEKDSQDSYLVTGDCDGQICFFDLTKPIDQRRVLYIPSHKRMIFIIILSYVLADTQINNILITRSLDGEQHILSCSCERELKIWSRDNGSFIKKYNLSSFTCRK